MARICGRMCVWYDAPTRVIRGERKGQKRKTLRFAATNLAMSHLVTPCSRTQESQWVGWLVVPVIVASNMPIRSFRFTSVKSILRFQNFDLIDRSWSILKFPIKSSYSPVQKDDLKMCQPRSFLFWRNIYISLRYLNT